MKPWSYGERFCLLCERPGYPTDYRRQTIPLCQYHKASYRSHGLRKLDKMYREGKLGEAEGVE